MIVCGPGSTKFGQCGSGSRTIKSLNLFRTTFKSQEEKIFSNLYLNLRDRLLSFRLEKYNFKQKTPKNLMVKLCFSLYFIPLDPDQRTQMNADPTGSESILLVMTKTVSNRAICFIKAVLSNTNTFFLNFASYGVYSSFHYED